VTKLIDLNLIKTLWQIANESTKHQFWKARLSFSRFYSFASSVVEFFVEQFSESFSIIAADTNENTSILIRSQHF
jgi:hypothetical protein